MIAITTNNSMSVNPRRRMRNPPGARWAPAAGRPV
jgi:hypothetical protein